MRQTNATVIKVQQNSTKYEASLDVSSLLQKSVETDDAGVADTVSKQGLHAAPTAGSAFKKQKQIQGAQNDPERNFH